MQLLLQYRCLRVHLTNIIGKIAKKSICFAAARKVALLDGERGAALVADEPTPRIASGTAHVFGDPTNGRVANAGGPPFSIAASSDLNG